MYDDDFPAEKLYERWTEAFGPGGGRSFYWAAAPGRINLIGEHTDYHGGFVLPSAIDLKTYVLAAAREDDRVCCWSVNLGEMVEFEVDGPDPATVSGWGRYAAGVPWTLVREGLKPPGVEAVVLGLVPFGSGLSSSASFEVAWITLFNVMAKWGLSARRVAELGQRAENEFAGVPCGIMDQFASSACPEGQAILLDCRSLEARPVPIPRRWRIVVCDTGVRHDLATSEYGRRQQECRLGLDAVKRRHARAHQLRDVDADMLEEVRGEIPERSYRRCRYVLSENLRTLAFAEALPRADAARVSELMAASHRGLRDDYEVSCLELDRAVELAQGITGVVGARMTGGGFGGCTVNLVEAERAEAFRSTLEDAFRGYTGGKGKVFLLDAGKGAHGGEVDGKALPWR